MPDIALNGFADELYMMDPDMAPALVGLCASPVLLGEGDFD